jgi:hypothetical protein
MTLSIKFLVMTALSLAVMAVDLSTHIIPHVGNKYLTNQIFLLAKKLSYVAVSKDDLDRQVQACFPCNTPPDDVNMGFFGSLWTRAKKVITGESSEEATNGKVESISGDTFGPFKGITIFDIVYFFVAPPLNSLLSVFGTSGTLIIGTAVLTLILYCIHQYIERHERYLEVQGYGEFRMAEDTQEVDVEKEMKAISELALSQGIYGILKNVTVGDLLVYSNEEADSGPTFSTSLVNGILDIYLEFHTTSVNDDFVTCQLEFISCETNVALANIEGGN